LNHALDACAMIAYLRAESGGEKVAQLLSDQTENCYAHTVNLIEVYYGFMRRSSAEDARQALAVLRADGVTERRDMSRDFAAHIGQLKSRGRISLADCFCIALAQKISGEVVTTDHHEFDALVPLRIVPICFIR